MSKYKKSPDLSEKSTEPICHDKKLTAVLSENCTAVRALMNNSSDIIIKYFSVGGHSMASITCEGMTNTEKLADLIFRPLFSSPPQIANGAEFMSEVVLTMPIAEEQKQVYDVDALCLAVMSGFAVLLCEGADFGIAIGI